MATQQESGSNTECATSLGNLMLDSLSTSTPQIASKTKTPQVPSNRHHKALNGGTLGGLGRPESPSIQI